MNIHTMGTSRRAVKMTAFGQVVEERARVEIEWVRRILRILAATALVGCNSTQPSSPYPGYFLSQVDDQYLPVPYAEDGTELIASGLAFTDGQRPRPDRTGTGLVNYSITVRPPGGTAHTSTVQLAYDIEDGTLTINLCPPLALCITTDVLTGPLGAAYEDLVLTRVLAGSPRSIYRFSPVLAE